MKRIVYGVFNIIYQLVICWCLLFANTYSNDSILESLGLKEIREMDSMDLLGYASIKTLMLLVEAAILISIIYTINRLVLSDTEDNVSNKMIANRSAKINIIATICFIAVLIWGSFRGDLW